MGGCIQIGLEFYFLCEVKFLKIKKFILNQINNIHTE